jgi:hypothetical protein
VLVVIDPVEREFTLATVRFWGKPKEFVRVQEAASRLVTDK